MVAAIKSECLAAMRWNSHAQRLLVETVERAAIVNQGRLLGLEYIPDRLLLHLRMPIAASLRQAACFQKTVQLGIIGAAKPRRENLLTRVANLVLNLAARIRA
jgi:hypothetical protein